MGNSPWTNDWDAVGELGKGGQGVTSLLRRKGTGEQAVLKVLRNQRSLEARRRMLREVTNLKTLASAGCKVPGVIESNVDQFGAPDVKLYFVMDYIPGEDLSARIGRGVLGIDDAAAVVLDMAATMDKALRENVIHRDLKPENVLLRSVHPADVILLDYGLSFNQMETDNITEAGETLDNKFLSLPERRVPGGDRRDPRSDLAGLCGIFYYCLVGEPPVDLADQNARPPHRRPGRSIRDRFPNDPRASHLEVFFDRGFATPIDLRFQSVDEFLSRLKACLSPMGKRCSIDPTAFAKASAERLLKHDRKTQLAAYAKNAASIVGPLRERAREFRPEHTALYHLNLADTNLEDVALRCGETETLSDARVCVQIGLAHSEVTRRISYEVRARGGQCGVFRGVFRGRRKTKDEIKKLGYGEAWDPIGEAECILWYDGLNIPDPKGPVEDLVACIQEMMESIEREVLSDVKTKQ